MRNGNVMLTVTRLLTMHTCSTLHRNTFAFGFMCIPGLNFLCYFDSRFLSVASDVCTSPDFVSVPDFHHRFTFHSFFHFMLLLLLCEMSMVQLGLVNMYCIQASGSKYKLLEQLQCALALILQVSGTILDEWSPFSQKIYFILMVERVWPNMAVLIPHRGSPGLRSGDCEQYSSYIILVLLYISVSSCTLWMGNALS